MEHYFEQVFPVYKKQSEKKSNHPVSNLEVCFFKCLTDNYGFLVHDQKTNETVCIDTPDADTILKAARYKKWKITQIWNTHHHFDHISGNTKIKLETGANLFAPEKEKNKIPNADFYLKEGDSLFLGNNPVQILETPGHTLGHIIYLFPDAKLGFVGDCLFVLGCGRLFEGSAEQMWRSLQKLTSYSKDNTLFCAHEYSQANAKFACSIDPKNLLLKRKSNEIAEKRQQSLPTIPILMSEELKTNPFLRANIPEIAKNLGMEASSPEAVFAKIRKMKDQS